LRPFVLSCLTSFVVLAVAAPPGAVRAKKFHATLSFSDVRSREVWIQPGQCTGPTKDSKSSTSLSADVSLVGSDPADNVYIWDHKTGALAITTVDALNKAVNLALPASAFKDLASVIVDVVHDGKPVAESDVILDDGRTPQGQVLDAASKGELTFYDIKPGAFKVTVRYKTQDGADKSLIRVFKASLGHGDPSAKETVSISDAVATAPMTDAATSPPPQTQTQTQTTSSKPVRPIPAGASKDTGNVPPASPNLARFYWIAPILLAGLLFLYLRSRKLST
jgi:hypothetical protein